MQSVQLLHIVHFVMKSNGITKNEFYEIKSSFEFLGLVLKSVNTNDKECYRLTLDESTFAVTFYRKLRPEITQVELYHPIKTPI